MNSFLTTCLLQPFTARVISEEKGIYRVQPEESSSLLATLSGRMTYKAQSREDFPAVGDYVEVEVPQGADRAVIREIHPRKNMLARRGKAQHHGAQIMATNVDTMLIATSVNLELNVRRLARYVSVAHEASVRPFILLTKADLSEVPIEEVRREVQQRFPGIEVEFASSMNFAEKLFFKDLFCAGSTTVIVGSSGVGKSTLTNFLVEGAQIETQPVREDDDKGRHTTTSRNLYLTRFGGAIIDTPGIRSLGLCDHEEGVQAQFAEVEDLFSRCKFRNCSHTNEPGCAVLDAIDSGELSLERWQIYCKLKREVQRARTREDGRLRKIEVESWKRRSRELRQRDKVFEKNRY